VAIPAFAQYLARLVDVAAWYAGGIFFRNANRLTPLSIAVPDRSLYLKGCALVLSAGIFWSFTGLLMRIAARTDAWQYLCYRSLGIGIAALLWNRWQHGAALISSLISLRFFGFITVCCISLASTCFIFAAKSTTIANTLFLSSCSPLLAAILAFALLAEKLDWRAILPIAVGLTGVLVMVRGEIGAGNMFGNIMAFGSALGFAGYTICLRRAGARDLSAIILGYALLTMILSAVMIVVAAEPLLPPLADLSVALLNGLVPLGIGTILYQRGAPFVSAVGLAFLSQTEAVFGPLWVWLFMGETPLPTTLLGGGIILTAVILMALLGTRHRRMADAP
jgi:drug/metabolite transporter, DME family